MGRISKPRLKLEYLYQQFTGDRIVNILDMYRAYYRNEDKKFIPYGWVVESNLGLFTFSDEEIKNFNSDKILTSI